MPLTEREQRTLARIERGLAADYPKLARLLARPGRWTRARWGRYRVILRLFSAGSLAALAGAGLAYGLAR